ncbi:alpha/beta fold hydrolase [Celeribacter sp.]|uniref:alpha/beta fold hydrolase n=1 Tax=Celeribacter sp. TaxID=1890673 RepID=UPI003A935A12
MTIPVLFLHGWAMSGAYFDDLASRLGPAFACHAPDLPGHGSRAQDEPSLENCAEVAKEWIDRLDRPVLVGWSMGAAVAWRYIAQHGTSGLRGLVTIDMSPRMMPDADWSLGLLGGTAETILATSEKIIPKWPAMAGSIARNMYARSSDPIVSRDAVETFLLAQDPARLRPLWDDLTAMDERQTIAGIDIPYLVCSGAQSRLYKQDAAHWIAAQAGQARVESFENSGHSPHLEEPSAFCDALKRFIAQDALDTSSCDQKDAI